MADDSFTIDLITAIAFIGAIIAVSWHLIWPVLLILLVYRLLRALLRPKPPPQPLPPHYDPPPLRRRKPHHINQVDVDDFLHDVKRH